MSVPTTKFSAHRGKYQSPQQSGAVKTVAAEAVVARGPVMPESFQASRKAAAAKVFAEAASGQSDDSASEGEGEGEAGSATCDGDGGGGGGGSGGATAAKRLRVQDERKARREKLVGLGGRWVSGVKIIDVLEGTGKRAQKGRECKIAYTLETTDGKEMDRCTVKKPFKFRLGLGGVVKGMDIGMAGMCVGGHRRIAIPAVLGYGDQKVEIIPANSDLVFDVRLLSVE